MLRISPPHVEDFSSSCWGFLLLMLRISPPHYADVSSLFFWLPTPPLGRRGGSNFPQGPLLSKEGGATAPLVALSLGYSGIHKPSCFFFGLAPLLFPLLLCSFFLLFFLCSLLLCFLPFLLRIGFSIVGVRLFACSFFSLLFFAPFSLSCFLFCLCSASPLLAFVFLLLCSFLLFRSGWYRKRLEVTKWRKFDSNNNKMVILFVEKWNNLCFCWWIAKYCLISPTLVEHFCRGVPAFRRCWIDCYCRESEWIV